MQKIISLFCRNYDGDRLVRDEIVPGAEWVIAGEGTATVKFDGTCCMVRDGRLYRRYDAWVSGKKKRQPPAGFEPAQEPDPVTGHWPGWVPVGDGPEDRWHREAFSYGPLADGTYELVGPKVQGNPHAFDKHLLLRHGETVLGNAPRSYGEIKDYFEAFPVRAGHRIEGIVWHHPDGRMVKIKRRDFGLRWPP